MDARPLVELPGVPSGPERGRLHAERLPYASDVVVEYAADWTYKDISEVADALGVRDIDLLKVADWTWDEDVPPDAPMYRDGGGCPSCGHGDRLVVRGVLTPAAMDKVST